MPYRVPSPPEPEEPDTDEPYALLLRSQQRRGRVAASILACATGAAVLASIARPAPTPAAANHPIERLARREEARRARATEAIASAQRRAAEAQQVFAAEVRRAVLSGAATREELGSCPLPLDAPKGGSLRGRAFPMIIVTPAEVEEERIPSQAIADVLADVQRADAHRAAGRYEEAVLYAEALDHPGRLVLDVVLVESESTKPEVTSHGSFVPGEVAGRAYLYDFSAQRVVCAADVRAKSSSQIGYAYAVGLDAPTFAGRSPRLKEAIDQDLRVQIERAIAASMRRLAPETEPR